MSEDAEIYAKLGWLGSEERGSPLSRKQNKKQRKAQKQSQRRMNPASTKSWIMLVKADHVLQSFYKVIAS